MKASQFGDSIVMWRHKSWTGFTKPLTWLTQLYH